MLTVDQIQIATKMFEHDGIECFSSVKEKFGKEEFYRVIIKISSMS